MTRLLTRRALLGALSIGAILAPLALRAEETVSITEANDACGVIQNMIERRACFKEYRLGILADIHSDRKALRQEQKTERQTLRSSLKDKRKMTRVECRVNVADLTGQEKATKLRECLATVKTMHQDNLQTRKALRVEHRTERKSLREGALMQRREVLKTRKALFSRPKSSRSASSESSVVSSAASSEATSSAAQSSAASSAQ